MLFIFDMGGVVTSTFKFDEFYKKLKLSSQDFIQICKKDYNIFSQLQTGKICIKEFWNIFNERSKEQNIEPVKNDLFRLYFHPKLNTETVSIINTLKKKHRVVCGTNTIQSHWENHLECGDYAFFNQTYPSNKIARIKPNVDFFETILKAENYSPEDAFFTDDKIENCEAAAKLGIKVHHFTSEEKLFEEWSKYI